jgi:hypothetical protein
MLKNTENIALRSLHIFSIFVLRAEIVTIFGSKMVTIFARNTNILKICSINNNIRSEIQTNLAGINVPVNSNCDHPPSPREPPRGFDQSLITQMQKFDANLSPPRRAFDSVRGCTKLVGGCTQTNRNL